MRTSLSSRPSSAHPRAGGENNWRGEGTTCSEGSSPRGRGKPMSDSGRGIWLRLIPARAGKTGNETVDRSGDRAHPRAGGENGLRLLVGDDDRGSSPRGRGKRRRRVPRSAGGRLIPARAGKTSRSRGRDRPGWAHPRAGGENYGTSGVPFCAMGSSPRGRGKLALAREARAYDGSSPRGRGKPPVMVVVTAGSRLIPTRAGKTPPANMPRRASWAHPRAGGENRPHMRTHCT